MVSEAIVLYRDVSELFHDLGIRLHPVLDFDFLVLIRHDAEKEAARLHILETSHPK